MFIQAVRFSDVRMGDVVCKKVGENCEITGWEQASEATYPKRILYRRDGGTIEGHPDELIGLVHRPWSKPEFYMMGDIDCEVRTLSIRWDPVRGISPKVKQDVIQILREAIEAYELGKPLDPGKK